MIETLPGLDWETSARPIERPACARRPSSKQGAILAAVAGSGEITLAAAVALVGGDIYQNQAKHVGAVLGNMVRRGMLRRVKPGVFSLPNGRDEPRP